MLLQMKRSLLLREFSNENPWGEWSSDLGELLKSIEHSWKGTRMSLRWDNELLEAINTGNLSVAVKM